MPLPLLPFSSALSGGLRSSDKKRRNLTRDDDNAAKRSNAEEEEEAEDANQSVEYCSTDYYSAVVMFRTTDSLQQRDEE